MDISINERSEFITNEVSNNNEYLLEIFHIITTSD